MSANPVTAVHLHRDDCPETLALLGSIVGPGYRTDVGAFVDWDELASTLSTTETAVMRIAQALATIERHGGGVSGRLRQPLLVAVERACNG